LWQENRKLKDIFPMFSRPNASRFAIAALAAFGVIACSNERAADAAPPAAPAKTEAAAAKAIPNFTLTDQAGKSHELYKMTDAAAIVVVMQGVGCPIVQQLTPDIKDLQAAYEPKNIEFLMLNANNHDTREMIAAEAKNFDIKIPILKDEGQKVSEPLGVTRTAETFVIQPKTWKILYHGPISDRLTYGRAKAKADSPYVANALDAVLTGKPVPASQAMTDGCLIDYPARTKAG
jgi:cytochrome oxidase Cu insertion factor (SCO1/SenC/PrrC family)